jgi:hypothetical protein
VINNRGHRVWSGLRGRTRGEYKLKGKKRNEGLSGPASHLINKIPR